MSKKQISLFLNLLIVILEIIGLIVTYQINKRISYEFYTEDSNIIALISSFLFVPFSISKNKMPKWLKLLKYASTICLSVTFVVVIFILAPMYNFNYVYLLFHDSLLYQHFLCPIISIITFIFFDNIDELKSSDILLGISLTITYAVILVTLNLLGIVSGPYPFLMVKNQSLLMSIIWFIVIIGLTYFISFILQKLYLKFNNKNAASN